MFFLGGGFLFVGVAKCAPMLARFARACKCRFALCSDLFLDSINVLSQENSPTSTPIFRGVIRPGPPQQLIFVYRGFPGACAGPHVCGIMQDFAGSGKILARAYFIVHHARKKVHRDKP